MVAGSILEGQQKTTLAIFIIKETGRPRNIGKDDGKPDKGEH